MDIWERIAAERAALLATFEGLTPEQWETPSLCGQWTVRQVLGHLIVAADPPTGRFVLEAVKARGSFDKANDRLARAEAERPTADLIARYRERIGKRSTPPGLGPVAPLSDAILHRFDVRIPLGLPSERPAEQYEPTLGLLFDRRGQIGFVPRGRPALRWVAIDHGWTHGSGDEVEGAMADLALAASGRGARVDALIGPGQTALAAWLGR
jgi:uncharacterized protein (TIGR03083 family)